MNPSSRAIFEPGLIDYKFFCFNGRVGFVYGVMGRQLGVGAEIGIYTRSWERLEVSRKDEFPAINTLPMPKNYEKMVKIAEELSRPFPHVRIDMYNVNGDIRFGEFTFYDGSGYMEFNPDDFDLQAGNFFTAY